MYHCDPRWTCRIHPMTPASSERSRGSAPRVTSSYATRWAGASCVPKRTCAVAAPRVDEGPTLTTSALRVWIVRPARRCLPPPDRSVLSISPNSGYSPHACTSLSRYLHRTPAPELGNRSCTRKSELGRSALRLAAVRQVGLRLPAESTSGSSASESNMDGHRVSVSGYHVESCKPTQRQPRDPSTTLAGPVRLLR